MTQISMNSGVITLINVFTVEPANQRRLVELLTEATEVSVRQVGQTRKLRAFAESPLYADERTSSDRADWSVSCQIRTFAR
jgi:hypothetical protein